MTFVFIQELSFVFYNRQIFICFFGSVEKYWGVFLVS